MSNRSVRTVHSPARWRCPFTSAFPGPRAAGVPSTVVIAASFDDIIAITGFSIFINIAIAGGDNAAWQIASGPLQVRWAEDAWRGAGQDGGGQGWG
jgi:hypothetical protein